MSLKQFQFSITNMRTKENVMFIGDGMNIKDALSDAINNANSTFRPKNDGKSRPSVGVRVLTAKACYANRTLVEFEGDTAFTEPEKVTAEELEY